MRPEDPAFDGCSLAYGGGFDDELSDELIQHGHGGRAAFQRRAASYMGLAFGDVSALRRYARMFTRQEAWDDYGHEEMQDKRAMELGMGYYFSHSTALRPGSSDGWYYDGIDPDDGYSRPALPGHVAELEAIEAMKIVPDGWVADDSRPAWTFTDRFDMRGFPVLVAEEM